MILLGLLSMFNFFYWFSNPELIEDKFLFYLLVAPLVFDTLRIIYIWYHYWDISIPLKPKLTKKLTVDVFTTYFPGEPDEMIKETLIAIKNIKYPHSTYLCDEANDLNLKLFCHENGIIHVTRKNRINGKAGNINNALTQATGDICLILDPDHIPSDDFLDYVIPYFEDDCIGFVQTVQAYYNTEESFVAKGAAEQTFHFYGPVMMSMNSYETVNAIGANCIFRRKALDSIGGHAAGLSEDMHTAMQLHSKGWKSIYIPKIFTKGLVPASLTAYYKQQLKWSRGTLELLVAVYPKLFRKFSWRQKIHYGILPFHYLSGIIYLISFLIPIISLITATTPWKGNVINFGFLFFPIFISIIGIRFYIQKWVMDRSERGIHLIGGLLLTCTWWIYTIGFIYTIIRKKVPYLPTPKDDKELTSWKILIPNSLVAITSIFAIIYGLIIDLTPFSLFMSGFAFLNTVFMLYSFVFAYQKQKKIRYTLDFITKTSSSLKKIQDKIFIFWRNAALPLILITLLTCFSLQNYSEYLKWDGVKRQNQPKNSINYIGIFAPENDNGITDLKNVKKVSNLINDNFDIVSIYLAWDKNIDLKFPQSLIDSIYTQKSIPMITWEPWLNTFEDDIKKNTHVFDLISEGYFDDYLTQFSKKLKALQRPIFLRFAHEFDNPFYPWYVDKANDTAKFKKAWIHTYNIFKKNNSNNVIWIWNPWKSDNIISFYPGKEYIDWIGVNILNYEDLNQGNQYLEFENLYKPFQKEFKKLPNTPVIISEFGSLNNHKNQNKWLNNAFQYIEQKFTEIKSVIYFNSKVDNNYPTGKNLNTYLDWTISEDKIIKNSFNSKELPNYVLKTIPILEPVINQKKINANQLKNIKGVNLKKGQNWKNDYHVLSRKNLQNDFKEMKLLGINSIKFIGNSVYEYNVLNIAKENDLNISYAFWIPAGIDFVNDTLQTKKLKKKIINKIIEIEHFPNISSWNIENDVLKNQANYYNKPELIFQNIAYLKWLKNLTIDIKKIDNIRILTLDLEIDQQSIYRSKIILDNIPNMDMFALVVKDSNYLESFTSYMKNINKNYIYSDIDISELNYSSSFDNQKPFFLKAWQDTHESNKLTFDGLLDRKGRFKPDYLKLMNLLQKKIIDPNLPKIKILKPAKLVYENINLNYQAMYYDNTNGWKYVSDESHLKLEWSIVKCDSYGNFIAIKDIGDNPNIVVKIPKDYERYRIMLTVMNGNYTTTNMTTLNTPLNQKNN